MRISRLANYLRTAIAAARSVNGAFPRECPICGFAGLFQTVGMPPRPDALCPGCESMERHRLFSLALRKAVNIPAEARFLHFAPEPALRRFLSSQYQNYFCADLNASNVDCHIDIERINLPDSSVDAILCSHVLEHVDDRRALSEMFRILKAGGAAYILIPVIEGWRTTYENPTIQTPEGRHLHFGQQDHVRWYGADCRDRMSAAGFHVREFKGSPEDCVTYGLIRGETLFICERP